MAILQHPHTHSHTRHKNNLLSYTYLFVGYVNSYDIQLYHFHCRVIGKATSQTVVSASHTVLLQKVELHLPCHIISFFFLTCIKFLHTTFQMHRVINCRSYPYVFFSQHDYTNRSHTQFLCLSRLCNSNLQLIHKYLFVCLFINAAKTSQKQL